MLFTAFSSHLVKMMTETSVFLSCLCSALLSEGMFHVLLGESVGELVSSCTSTLGSVCRCAAYGGSGAKPTRLLSWSTSPKRSEGIQTLLRRCVLWQSSLAVYLLPCGGPQADQGTHSLNSLLSSPHPLSPKCPRLVFVLDH